MSKIKIRSAYDADLNDHDTGLICPEPTLTKQADAAACDVNLIVSRWLKSGGAMDLSQRVGQFLDVSDIPDFHACQSFIASANSLFGSLSSEIREKFDNDPGQFLSFASDPANEEALSSMGIIPPIKPVEGAGHSNSPQATSTGGASADAPNTSSSDALKTPPVGA